MPLLSFYYSFNNLFPSFLSVLHMTSETHCNKEERPKEEFVVPCHNEDAFNQKVLWKQWVLFAEGRGQG